MSEMSFFKSEAGSSSCSFSYDGLRWLQATDQEDLGGDVDSVFGPMVQEPGWDFYRVSSPPASGPGSCILHVRREAPIRLVRIYAHWPSLEAPLVDALRPEGLKDVSVPLPDAAMKLSRLLVAVCPRTSSTCFSRGPSTSPSSPSSPSTPMVDGSWRSGPSPVSGGTSTEEIWPEDSSELVADLQAKLAFKTSGRGGSANGREGSRAGDLLPPIGGEVQRGLATAKAQAAPRAPSRQESLRLLTQAERLSRDLEDQTARRRWAEAEVSRLLEERDELRRKLRSSERAILAGDMKVRALTREVDEVRRRMETRTLIGGGAARSWMPASIDEVVAGLVSLEMQQLNRGAAQERLEARRKLLLRWHPDKSCGGAGGGGEIATRVLQEMQRRPEWNIS